MSQELRELQARIARIPRNGGRNRRYDEALKVAVANYATRGRERGESDANMARALGLPEATVRYWRSTVTGNRPAKHPVGFRPVTLQTEPPARSRHVSRPVVVLPGGIRIEGLRAEELPELVRGLLCSA